jgi:hypothetical protein
MYGQYHARSEGSLVACMDVGVRACRVCMDSLICREVITACTISLLSGAVRPQQDYVVPGWSAGATCHYR